WTGPWSGLPSTCRRSRQQGTETREQDGRGCSPRECRSVYLLEHGAVPARRARDRHALIHFFWRTHTLVGRHSALVTPAAQSAGGAPDERCAPDAWAEYAPQAW